MNHFEEIIREIELNERSLPRQIQITNEIKQVRCQIIDWMIIVFNKLNFRDETFFQAMEILDSILIKYKFNLSSEDVHLIAIVSLFIASKYEEVKPISLKSLVEKVCHGKYSKSDIIAAEMLVLKKLNFKIPRNHFLNFSYSFSQTYFAKYEKSQEFKNTFDQILRSVYKMQILDFSFNSNNDILAKYFSIFTFALVKTEKKTVQPNTFSKNVSRFCQKYAVENENIIKNFGKIEKIFQIISRSTDLVYFKQTNTILFA
jgi:uncharacterized protein (DUF924 family)